MLRLEVLNMLRSLTQALGGILCSGGADLLHKLYALTRLRALCKVPAWSQEHAEIMVLHCN